MAGTEIVADVRVAHKIIKLFAEIKHKADEIIKKPDSAKQIVDKLMVMFRKETEDNGKEMLAELLTALGEHFLEHNNFIDEEQRDRFIDANIGQDILDEADFTCPYLEFKAAPAWAGALKVGLALFGSGAGAALIAGWLKPETVGQNVPMGIGISALVGVAFGLVDYLKIEPKNMRMELEIVVIRYIKELRERFSQWVQSREDAFEERIQPYIAPEIDEEIREGDFPV